MKFTTMAVGESGQDLSPPIMTTMAVGEEEGSSRPPVKKPRVGGDLFPRNLCDPFTVTTMAVGEEESGTKPPPWACYPSPIITTMAMGSTGNDEWSESSPPNSLAQSNDFYSEPVAPSQALPFDIETTMVLMYSFMAILQDMMKKQGL
jgi:hypothetical protein